MKKGGRAKSVVSILVVLIILAAAGFVGYKFFQVKDVLVQGNKAYSADYIVGLANIPEKTHMLKVDEAQIKKNIESVPYLELTEVDYKLPDTVILTVKEREPAALIGYAGKTLLVDRLLNVLEINNTDDSGKYPVVDGIVIDAVNLGLQISSADSLKLSVATSILDELKKQQITDMILTIDLSDINNITLKTNNGPNVLFGQGDAFDTKVHWIKKILPSLIRDGKTNGIVDVTTGTFASYRLEEQGAAATPGSPEAATQPSSGTTAPPSSEAFVPPSEEASPENEAATQSPQQSSSAGE